jgi:DNA-binding protein Fis
MKFGLLKSKIEKMLIESYKNDAIKRDVFVFNELIVKNKNLSKLYYLYDELNSNKGLNESLANEFVNQSVIIYENTINKIKPSELKEIQMWVGHIKCENQYKEIDNFFTDNVTNLVEKIQSKNVILETISKTPNSNKEVTKVPLKTMVDVANKTIESYLNDLSESDKKDLKNMLTENEEVLKESFYTIKGSVLGKLEKIKESEQDREVSEKINETINKVREESFDKISYLKLRKLNESL